MAMEPSDSPPALFGIGRAVAGKTVIGDGGANSGSLEYGGGGLNERGERGLETGIGEGGSGRVRGKGIKGVRLRALG